ncbi:hypothetical protein ATO13_22496 [Stappia sp. 22II-S9-Z10]|nr:hypothetical protein ATO13_22496 [Stappia sp. 22II-S9-Z10]
MKRDMDLIREILLHVEASETLHMTAFQLPGHGDEAVTEHAILCIEKGLLEGRPILTMNSREVLVGRLTWEGHDFLAAIRDETVWTRLKSSISQPLTSLPFDVIKSVGASLVQQMVAKQIGLT